MKDEPAEAIVARNITPNALTAQTDGRAGVVVFNVNHDPGWKTATPGADNPIKQRGRLAVRLASGTTQVTLRYQPLAFELGALVTASTLAFAVVRTLRRRASRDDRAS